MIIILVNANVAVILSYGLDYILLTISLFSLFKFKKNLKVTMLILLLIFCWLFALALEEFFWLGGLVRFLYSLAIYYFFLERNSEKNEQLFYMLLFILIKEIFEFILNVPINLFGGQLLHNHILFFSVMRILNILVTLKIYQKIKTYLVRIVLSREDLLIMERLLFLCNLALVFYFGYMKYQALYFDLLVFTSVILVGNGIVVGLVLFYVSRYSETKTREEAISQRLDYMVKYTNIIEENQLELKRFKHDYQNLLLSLSILAESGDLDKIKQKTASLRQYSAQQLLKEYTQYSDLARVHHTLLKSILIAKLTELHHMNIVFRFVCPEPVESLNIADFDLIRMVGILIDNAREHVKDMEDGMIAVSVHKTTHGTHIKVENTYGNQVTSITTLMTPGYSSKDNHSGLGLSNVEKIKNKYDHVFLNYHIDDKFEVTLIIMNEEGEY